jgi:hypothetical protein
MKDSRLRTMKSAVSVEILPKDNWEEVAYLTIKGMAVQAAGPQRQITGRPGAETLNQAVDALEAGADEIINVDEGARRTGSCTACPDRVE